MWLSAACQENGNHCPNKPSPLDGTALFMGLLTLWAPSHPLPEPEEQSHMGKEGRVAARFKHQPALMARSASGLQGWDISFECQKEEIRPPYTL